MAYTKNVPAWVEGAAPGISAPRLNHLETQYDEAKTDLDAHKINQAAGDGRHRWTLNKILKGAGAAPPTEMDTPALITSGGYTGNDAANRPIPHGLNAIPKIVLLVKTTTPFEVLFAIFPPFDRIYYFIETSFSAYTVSAVDATDFRVGNATNYPNSANGTGITYRWVAIG